MDTCFFAFVADHTTVADSVEAPITSSDPLTSRKAVMSHKLKYAQSCLARARVALFRMKSK